MACINENIIKNMANEVTRNCQTQNINMEVEFVVFIIELLLLNPLYGNLFAKSLTRTKLEHFVNVCLSMITTGGPALNTLKMQFIFTRNYDHFQELVDRRAAHASKVLQPLLDEIIEEDPDPEQEDESEFKKLYRKICIYILMATGLGSSGSQFNMQECMSALESVYDFEELYLFVTLQREEKLRKIYELKGLVAGIRLFNKHCNVGGEGIPDLQVDLEDAGMRCLSLLSNCLITVMQRVNSLTSALQDSITIDPETGNVGIKIPPDTNLTEKNYKHIFDLLIFNRQYEIYTRRLLKDNETLLMYTSSLQEQVKEVFKELDIAVKHKTAVPCDTVFPMFRRLWQVWQSMQNTMFLISTINRLMSILSIIQEHLKVPNKTLEKMLGGKRIFSDLERMDYNESSEVSLSGKNLSSTESMLAIKVSILAEYLGFCPICLCKGALMPGNIKVGRALKGRYYRFCSKHMAERFNLDPRRYIYEVLHYARNHPQIIILLNLRRDVEAVRHVDTLVAVYLPPVKVTNQEVQTAVHPIKTNIDRNHCSNLWEWKRKACQLAAISNARTHSTQTVYSHLRAEIQCQTVEPRDKCQQTKKDAGVMTTKPNFFIWGLRGMKTDGQHSMDLKLPHEAESKDIDDLSILPFILADKKSLIKQKLQDSFFDGIGGYE